MSSLAFHGRSIEKERLHHAITCLRLWILTWARLSLTKINPHPLEKPRRFANALHNGDYAEDDLSSDSSETAGEASTEDEKRKRVAEHIKKQKKLWEDYIYPIGTLIMDEFTSIRKIEVNEHVAKLPTLLVESAH
ncbi:uncharacterized protein ARMOST_04926 [Armillaria ostoyae]|uniref:Uncharacterized protein n=1 Tax=Armillaria ostoyae TaxID=47428 RepID=A0A284QYQ5_ARMOS|nr:uncharacterized protein ARMOST_04926 [Armillaria ostoyae]